MRYVVGTAAGHTQSLMCTAYPMGSYGFYTALSLGSLLRLLSRHSLTPSVRMHGVDGMVRLSFLSSSFLGYRPLCRASENMQRAVLPVVEAALLPTHEG